MIARSEPSEEHQSKAGSVLQRSQRPRVWEWTGNYTQSMAQDLRLGLQYWPLWGRIGWQDVMLRYRRSLLGPFWLTISMGVMVFSLGFIYGDLFSMDVPRYLPFLTAGFLIWGFITATLNEGCQVFIESEGIIRQSDLPLSLFPLRATWRNLIILFHNALIYGIVVLWFPVPLNGSFWLLIPGLLVLTLNALWWITLLGMLSARFRDLPQIVASVLQVAFFVTPIIWMPESARHRPLIVDLNPFYHLIEILRAPMLGQMPSGLNWAVALTITGLGGGITLLFYRRFHCRIAYWI